MTRHHRNPNGIPSTDHGVRTLAGLVFLALVSPIAPASASAADKPSKPPRVSVSRLGAADDLDLDIHIRHALGQDESFKHLSVLVKAGVAHIIGSVPSADLKKKAIAIVSGVPGVLQVRAEEVYLAKPPPVVKPLVLPLENDVPTRTRAASPNFVTETLETPTARAPGPPRPTWPTKVPASASDPRRVTLLAPEAVSAPSRASEPAVLTANPRTPPPPPSIAAAVTRLRQGDRRFRSILAEIDGSTVRVFSCNAPGEHVMAFVQAIRRLPGVQHVILKDTSSRPN